MPKILESKSIYFNDVNLIPNIGKVRSRKEVPNELYRVIVSPMLSVVGETFIKEAARLGLSVCTPRFIPTEQKIKLYTIFKQNKIDYRQICFISIGLNESQEELEKLSHDTDCRDIVIDIANGYIPQLKECVYKVWSEFVFNNLMVGNVVTSIGVKHLIDNLDGYCKNLFCRIGTGNGKPCSSSDVCGINRGQITELFECNEVKGKTNLVSDGGISKSGFVLKAFGAGSDYVLMGSYFSKALEAETHISGDGTYFGCASEKQNKLAGLDKHSEGKVTVIDKEELKPLEYLVKELWGGISSGISYVGHTSVSDFIGQGVFERKENSLPPKNRI